MLFATTLAILEELRAEARTIDPDLAEEAPTIPLEDDEIEEVVGILPTELQVLWIMAHRAAKVLLELGETVRPLLDAFHANELSLIDFPEKDVAVFSTFLSMVDRRDVMLSLFRLSIRRLYPDYAMYPYAEIREGWAVLFAERREADDADEAAGGIIDLDGRFEANCEGSDGAQLPVMTRKRESR